MSSGIYGREATSGLVDDGMIGRSPDCDPWDWEIWVEQMSDGGMVVLNMTRPGSGMYEVSTGLTIEEADQLGRAIANAVGRLAVGRGWRRP